MIYIETDILWFILLMIIATFPSTAFAIALIVGGIKDWKTEKKQSKKLLLEDKGEELEK